MGLFVVVAISICKDNYNYFNLLNVINANDCY